MKNFFEREPVRRALRTFLQVFIATLAGFIAAWNIDDPFSRERVLAAVIISGATALGYIMNRSGDDSDK